MIYSIKRLTVLQGDHCGIDSLLWDALFVAWTHGLSVGDGEAAGSRGSIPEGLRNGSTEPPGPR